MRIILLGLVILNLAQPARASGGSEAGNGGGIAEKRLLFAYQNFAKYLDSCLLTSLCHLTESEIKLLKQIRSSLTEEQKKLGQLEFQSGKSLPDSFMIDGQIRIARTGNNVGDKIYINTDLLYWREKNGLVQSIDLPSAISILVHEFGHHHGISDHVALDILGSKLQTLQMRQTAQTSIWNGDVQLTVVQNNIVNRDEDKKNLHEIDQILLGYGDNLIDLTPSLLAAMRCPPAQPKLENARKVLGLRIYNLHEERGVKFDKELQLSRKPLRAWYILSCASGVESDHGDILISLALKREPKTNAALFISEKSSFKQESCRDHVEDCK